MKNSFFLRFSFLCLLIFSFILALLLFRAPKPQPMNLVQEKFSADRAFEHVKQIARKPHSMATAEHSRVRDYIADELRKIGLETSIQSTTAMYDFRGSVSAGFVHNVIGVLKGRGSGKSILVTAHYDSQPNTLGAADDGAAVAAILESARALVAYPKLKNDVIFLISDGEEAGLFGAKAFAEQHPLMKNVGLVLNLEARGTKGPSYTYEVSPENGWLMREYAKAVRYPIASSLAYEVYKMMPNNSDFTIYKKLGYTGINTAFIESYVDYHSMTDSPENLSLRSLQHHGTYIMDIVKHFGELDLSNTKDDDLVFFNWMGSSMIWYPQSWNLALIVLITFAFGIVVYLGVKRKELHLLKALLGFLLFLGITGLSLGLVWLLQKAIPSFYPWFQNFDDANFYNVGYYFIAFAALCLAITSLVYALLYKKLGLLNLWVGVLFFALIVLFVIQLYLPTGLFFALLPLLLFTTVLYLKFLLKIQTDSPLYLLIICLFSFPVITMIMPFVKILYITFGLGLAIGASFVFILLVAYLLPVLGVVFKMNRWVLPLISFTSFITFMFVAHLSSDYNENRPYKSDLVYCQNAETQKSLWVSNSLYLDKWKQQYFGNASLEPLIEIFPNAQRTRLKNEAPYMEIPKPDIHIYSDSLVDGNRVLKLNVCSNLGAENAHVYLHGDASIKELKINGFSIEDEAFYSSLYGGYHLFNFYGIYDTGFDLEISFASDSLEMIIVEKKLGLPEFDQFEKMPAYIVPQAGYTSNMIILRSDWEL